MDNTELIKIKDERNYGIDLLRIFSMFLVVVLHCFGQGGILHNAIIDSFQYKFSWFLEICAYCAVNIFGLISGYVSYNDEEKEFKFHNYIKIWLEVVFYGLLITCIFNFIDPNLISKRDYVITLLPVTNGLYWYFTAYTGLFVIMPFLNRGIRACTNTTLKKLLFVIILVFSIFDTISNRFVLNSGYSFIWLTLLYIIGAIIKKCKIGSNFKTYKSMIIILFLCIATYLYKIYGFSIKTLNIEITKNLLVCYTSPTILGCAILYLISFSKIKFNDFFKKIIKFIAPSAFSIYILNNHRLFWNNIMKDLFANISNESIIIILGYVIGFSLLFVILSITIDKFRLFFFKIIKVEALTKKISRVFKFLINKIINLLII